jgi:hypothetical protein
MKTENWNDKKFVLEKVKQTGWALEYASDELKKDKEVVLEAAKENGWALQFASAELLNDKDFMLEAVKQWGMALQYASEELQNNKEFVLSSLKENLWNHLFSSDSDCDISHDPSDYNEYTCNSWCCVKGDIFSALRYAKIDLEQNDK